MLTLFDLPLPPELPTPELLSRELSLPFMATGVRRPVSSSTDELVWCDLESRSADGAPLRRDRVGESTPRRRLSATMALRGFDSGDTNGPGIIRAIDFLVNVDGRSALDGNRCWWLSSREVDGRGSCASDGSIGDEALL